MKVKEATFDRMTICRVTLHEVYGTVEAVLPELGFKSSPEVAQKVDKSSHYFLKSVFFEINWSTFARKFVA